MFRSPCWGQVLSKHLRLAVAAPLAILFSSCSVSILASSGSQRHETDAMSALGQKQTFTPQGHVRFAPISNRKSEVSRQRRAFWSSNCLQHYLCRRYEQKDPNDLPKSLK